MYSVNVGLPCTLLIQCVIIDVTLNLEYYVKLWVPTAQKLPFSSNSNKKYKFLAKKSIQCWQWWHITVSLTLFSPQHWHDANFNWLELCYNWLSFKSPAWERPCEVDRAEWRCDQPQTQSHLRHEDRQYSACVTTCCYHDTIWPLQIVSQYL